MGYPITLSIDEAPYISENIFKKAYTKIRSQTEPNYPPKPEKQKKICSDREKRSIQILFLPKTNPMSWSI